MKLGIDEIENYNLGIQVKGSECAPTPYIHLILESPLSFPSMECSSSQLSCFTHIPKSLPKPKKISVCVSECVCVWDRETERPDEDISSPELEQRVEGLEGNDSSNKMREWGLTSPLGAL